MRSLLIMRHAKSSWDYPELPDIVRPLNNRGKEASKKMGHYLAQLKYKPDLIVSSPATRAYHTSISVAQILGYRIKNIVLDRRLYFEGVEGMMATIKECNNSYEHVAIFSHEPTCSSFCEMMSNSSIAKFPTGAAFMMRFETSNWNNIPKLVGERIFFSLPRHIKLNNE